ncbi:MAG: outer membrane protein assembly factor BamA [Deltaproteobacteria bacterium]|nr:outer membrane protein assembly factor BamA [Deltaproteobacteria bacterium]
MNTPRPLRLAVAALVAALAAMPVHAHAQAMATQQTEPPAARAPVVAAVRVAGQRRVEESAIRIHLSQKTGAVLDESLVDADIKAVYGMGFFETVWVTREPAAGGVDLVYHVTERPYIAAIVFDGNENVDVKDLEAVVGVRSRTVFDPQKAWEGLREAKKTYAGEGYPDAEVTYTLDVDEEGLATVKYHVVEGNKVLVEDIRFEGVKAFSKRKLRGVMTTRRKWMFSWVTGAGILKHEELQTDVERLTAFYYDQGYIQVRVDDPEVTREGDDLIVTVRIEEGEQYRIGKLQFEGEVLLGQEELVKASRLETGTLFRPSRLRESIFGLTEAYGNLGHAFAEVIPDTDLNPDEKTVDVHFKLSSGPVVSVDRIDIKGNTKTRDYVVRREMRIQEGERFSGKGLRESKERVRRTGLFDEVDIASTRTDLADQVNLLVDVKEGRTGTFSAGAGFSSEDSLLANARITERNLFGRAQTATVNVDFGSRRQNYRLGFTEPWAFDIPLLLGIDAFSWNYRFSDFERGGTGASVRASYPLWELGLRSLWGLSLDEIRAGLEYRIENAVIQGLSRTAPASIVLEQGSKLTSSLRPSIVRNTVDQPFDPSEGSINSISAEFAGLGGESDFWKLDVASRWYWPLYTSEAGRKLVYSFNATFGYGVGDAGTTGAELPLSERYFPGGINTIRGFSARSLGPREDFCETDGVTCDYDEPIGGSSELIFNNEVIFPIIPDAGVKGVVFFDAGNAFSRDAGIDIGEFRYAVGFGMRWLSPFGPLRIELGFPLNKQEGDSESLVLFSFGTPY